MVSPLKVRKLLGIGVLLAAGIAYGQDRIPELSATSIDPVSIRFGTSFSEDVAINVVAFAYDFEVPGWFGADHLELAVGAISRGEQSRALLSLGPVWRWESGHRNSPWFLDLGLAPTALSGGKFDGRDLGGNLHFTSSAEIGRSFGKNSSSTISLRLQHLSNGGLNDTNPGLDTIFLGFSYNMGGS